MGRNILFITTDQQRYDSLGCNGGIVARTPVVWRRSRSVTSWWRPLRQLAHRGAEPQGRLPGLAASQSCNPERAAARKRIGASTMG